jgi:hypothetical protein
MEWTFWIVIKLHDEGRMSGFEPLKKVQARVNAVSNTTNNHVMCRCLSSSLDVYKSGAAFTTLTPTSTVFFLQKMSSIVCHVREKFVFLPNYLLSTLMCSLARGRASFPKSSASTIMFCPIRGKRVFLPNLAVPF